MRLGRGKKRKKKRKKREDEEEKQEKHLTEIGTVWARKPQGEIYIIISRIKISDTGIKSPLRDKKKRIKGNARSISI